MVPYSTGNITYKRIKTLTTDNKSTQQRKRQWTSNEYCITRSQSITMFHNVCGPDPKYLVVSRVLSPQPLHSARICLLATTMSMSISTPHYHLYGWLSATVCCRDLRSVVIRFDFKSYVRFKIRFVLMVRFEIFESSTLSVVIRKETIGGG